jgi:hypothetical protein
MMVRHRKSLTHSEHKELRRQLLLGQRLLSVALAIFFASVMI